MSQPLSRWQRLNEHLTDNHRWWFNFSGVYLFVSSTLALFMYVYVKGFTDMQTAESNFAFRTFDFFFFGFYFLGTAFRAYLDRLGGLRRVSLFEYLISASLIFNLVFAFISDIELLNQTMVVVVFALELSKYSFNLSQLRLSPTLIFVVSFLIVIFVGAILLMLPNANNVDGGIRFLDALFTSASAATVTGLAVLDTQTQFSTLGQTIILLVIQIGGLGMMTFTSFFGLFFKGESSFQNTLLVQDYVGADKTSEAFKFLIKTVVFTLGIEFIGFLLLYACTTNTFINDGERLFFSVFHSISAFCNAGFSTLSNGLYDIHLRFNYPLQWVICALIVAGGIGFPIMFNLYEYLKYSIVSLFRRWFRQERFIHKAWVINLNTRIVLYTTSILLIAGTIFFYIFEREGVIAEHNSYFGQFTTAVFGSVTPRTAGFNTFNMGELAVPTMLLMMFLMWIGGSPASTGGGIKTSTFAVAVLNIFSVGTGRTRIDLGRRTLAEQSINRAFAIIMLSFLVIGLSTFLMAYFEPDKKFLDLAFEVFSAYCTVGLSVGITSSLNDGGKIVIICTMFLGRVGTLNLIISLLHQVRHTPYEYPRENIMIN